MSDVYAASAGRYEGMIYNRVGRSGLKFPAITLGFWHNFGSNGNYDTMKAMCRTAFDHGITQFDLANNYGPVYGSAEENAGRILREDFRPYRDELVITSKAGYDMWAGPYGDWGSRKYLVASCDQSLKRLGLSYVDIFYHHRMDPETPLEETMEALDFIVKSGRALYAAISNYDRETAARAQAIMRELHCPLIVVLGHTGCGAVGAALSGGADGFIRYITDEILLAAGEERDPDRACRLNVRHAVEVIRREFKDHPEIPTPGLEVRGAVYDIRSGVVEWL